MQEQGQLHMCVKAVVKQGTFPGKFDQIFQMIIVSVVYYKPNDNMSNDTCYH